MKVWRLGNGELLRTISDFSAVVRAIAIHPDNQTLTDHTRPILSVAISADGRTLVSGSEDKTIKVWRLR